MSEEADNSTSATAPVPTAVPAAPVATPVEERPRHSRVTQAAAWVGIVAGVVFIVAVVFLSGFILGKQSGGGHHRGGPDREMGMVHRGGPPMGPPHIFFPGGPGMQGGPGSQGGPGFQQGPQGPAQGQNPGPGNAPATPPRP